MKNLALWTLGLFVSLPLQSGAFNLSLNFAQNENAINHPVLYLGAGGEREISVCLDPNSADVDLREPAVGRAIATWNGMLPESDNISADVPSDQFDFETTLLHELGHCLFGLGHPNLGSLVTGDDRFATASLEGSDGSFDIDYGVDGEPGSADDIRGDDVNLMWFFKVDNYPYVIASAVDSTTFSRDPADLPR